jgi:hypothetical protein
MDAFLAAWAREAHALISQSGATSVALMVATACALTVAALFVALSSSASGNHSTTAQSLFSAYVSLGRIRNLLCSPCDRARGRYPQAITCQIPFFRSLSDVFTFIWGYKTEGLFVEIGGYDGESFSNTSCLADMGWRGAYAEPIPSFAAACKARHAGNAGVVVHQSCVGEVDGAQVTISTAGPFSSAVADEVSTVSTSSLNGMLEALGWAHTDKANASVTCTTVSLDSFMRRNVGVLPPAAAGGSRRRGSTSSASRKGMPVEAAQGPASPSGGLGPVDLLVIDVEGLEWPILRSFALSAWRPGVVIIEIQELQARYRGNARVQADAAALFDYFAAAGYGILYKDVVNTVFVHRDLPIVGGA